MGTLSTIVESVRQLKTQDTKFWRKMGYIWELRTNPMAPEVPGGIILYPMVLPPTAYSFKQTFSVEDTETLGGNLVIEESGIIRGEINLRFDFGFQAKKSFPDTAWPPVPNALLGLSGQKHWLRVRRFLFERYSRLKKDTRFASDTRLILHIMKDGDDFEVVPKQLSMDRTRTTYPWSIDLLVVGDAAGSLPSRDNPIENTLRVFNDMAGSVRKASSTVRGAIADVSGIVHRVNQIVPQADLVLDEVGKIGDSLEDFVTGTERIIRTRKATIESTQVDIEETIRKLSENEEDRNIQALYHEMLDGLHRSTVFPDAFALPFEEEQSRARARSITSSEVTDAESASAATKTQELSSTGPQPGDVLRAAEQLLPELSQYSGFIEVTLARGDSLTSLASKYIGDPAKWEDIAIANRLRSPYLAEARLPGTKRTGDTIVIPVLDIPGARNRTTGGDPGTGSQVEAFLGTDFAMPRNDDNLRDFVIDTARGSLDIKTVSGYDNLSQGLGIRLEVAKRSCRVLPELGIERLVGYPNTIARVSDAEFKIQDSVLRDTRVEAVVKPELVQNADTVEVDLQVQIKGSEGLRSIPQVIT